MGYKILGQAVATTGQKVMEVEGGKEAVVSTITVCNTGVGATDFSVFVIPAGQSQSAEHTLYSKVPIPPTETFAATIGITLSGGDSIWAASTDGVVVHCYGRET